MKLPFQIDLTGKVVVVTGAGGVICSVLAEAMAMTGIFFFAKERCST